MRVLVAFALLAVLSAPAVPSTSAVTPPWHDCGAISIGFANPDLQPMADGAIHASGSVLMQFTLAGKGASNVTSVYFDLGEALPDALVNCSTPAGSATGAYPWERSDLSAHDGFSIAINTSAFPDGTYAAALRAVDTSGSEVARTYGAFTIANARDSTRPWPLVLPGDGVTADPAAHNLTIEFVEPVSNVLVTRNGEPLALAKWTPPARSDDLTPENPADSTPLRTKVWGPGFQTDASLKPGDTIRVVASDTAGNVADKSVTLPKPNPKDDVKILRGSSAPDPAITLAPVAGATREAIAGATTEWTVQVTNPRSATTNVSLTAGGPSGIDLKVEPTSVLLSPNGTATVTVTAHTDPQMQPATYSLHVSALWRNATGSYLGPAGLDLALVVHAPPPPPSPAEQEKPASVSPQASAARTPGPGPLVAFASLALGAAALAVRRNARR